ncbi:MAG: rod shape-determining protein MreC [Lachnospiraceae bacterium]|nr:rod shape-determining protein MreC [Lachnospiraceae bacterium]
METKRSKYLLIGLTVICILLIGITSIKDGIMEPLRTGVGYVLVPIQTGVNAVGKGIYTEMRDYSQLKSALAENEKLKDEVARLMEENNRLQAGQFELSRLRELYQLDQDYMNYEKIGARIIAKDSGDWFQVFRVNKGSADGVEVDDNVMAGGGLVGIVTDVGANYATVRSIIDDSSRVSAMAIQSGDNCIVAGDLTLFQEGRLRITNITKDGDVKDGDQIITSNISSKFLPGILIGYAADITVDPERLTKSGYLIPVADFDNLQEVLIITGTKSTGEEETETEAGEEAGS